MLANNKGSPYSSTTFPIILENCRSIEALFNCLIVVFTVVESTPLFDCPNNKVLVSRSTVEMKR